jgi:hypothetical protein
MNQRIAVPGEKPEYNTYLLKARLKRVSQEILEQFLGELKNIEDIPKTKESLAEEILNHYKIMKHNADFLIKFGNFMRDFVLSAGESEYLIEITDKESFIQWINEWKDNKFIGRKFNFYKNVYFELGDKFLRLGVNQDGSDSIEILDSINSEAQSEKYLSFPSAAFLLVAYSQEFRIIFSKDELLETHDTYEFEIILRKNSSLIGVRGNYRVVRDFFASVIEDSGNPLSMVQSLFIGDFDDKKSRPIAKPRRSINIEKLREALNGEYLDISAPVDGDQATRIKFSLKGMKNTKEETHPVFGPALNAAWKEQEKSRIGFCYNGKTYTFAVTNNGGLYFRQFAPEEVVTYILLKINNI